jgi:hypothetical protein
MGVGGQCHAPAALLPGKSINTHCTGGWVGPRANKDWCEEEQISCHTGVQTLSNPASGESLYRLCYPGPFIHQYTILYTWNCYYFAGVAGAYQEI